MSEGQKETIDWLRSLKRPTWIPPDRIMQPLWTIIYTIVIVSFGSVFFMALNGQLPWVGVATPFALNLLFHFAYPSIRLNLRSNVLTTINALLIVGTLIWGIVVIWSYAPWICIANIPYLLVAAFTTVLQSTITAMNWGK